jgi:hypothetical protein
MRNASFCAVDIVRRFAALFLIAVSLLLPAGSAPAFAPSDHRAMADCPHAAAAVHEPGSTQRPAGQAGMPQCCHALPMAAEIVAAAQQLALIPAARLLPGSDTLPASFVVGPDVPPPRTGSFLRLS